MTTGWAGAPVVVAIIPARGGSKGVPGKNLKRVGGVSLLARAVLAASSAEMIDAVYVSTDDAEIASAARSAGALVIDRPQELAGDSTSSEEVLLHGLDSLHTAADILVFMQATSPFIDPADLDRAISRVRDDESDVVFAARKSHAFVWRLTEAGAVGINHDASFRPLRQDMEPQFVETGAFYVMRAAAFRTARHRFFGRVGIEIVDELGAIDIDSADDLELANALAPRLSPRTRIDVDAVVTDFDGVHTDDRVHLAADGTEHVTVSRADGMGVSLLRRSGHAVLILSSERNPVVSVRADKLMVPVLQSVDDKATALLSWVSEQAVDLARVAYVGNDVNDLGCMDLVGWPIAVADAHRRVIERARIVLRTKGGQGAIRELADRILDDRTDGSPTLEEIWSRSRPTR
jgi:YrbI family 3-deoxy-D-manno-octulosonate 8-phosphate phosphatase